MTDRHLHTVRVEQTPTPITNDVQAAHSLDDGPFIAYALIQAFKLFSALVTKRWPHLK